MRNAVNGNLLQPDLGGHEACEQAQLEKRSSRVLCEVALGQHAQAHRRTSCSKCAKLVRAAPASPSTPPVERSGPSISRHRGRPLPTRVTMTLMRTTTCLAYRLTVTTHVS